MKKLIPIFLLLFSSFVHAQYYQGWSEPVRLTDSTSFNTNPVIAVTGQYWDGDLFMFYEKQFPLESSKQIWMLEISNPSGQEEVILANDTIVYRNPKILGNNFLIYECNQNGNFDIFGMKFDEFGNFEESFQLTNSPEDEKSFYTPDYYTNLFGSWEYEDKIMVADYIEISDTLQLTAIDTLDTGDCHDPVCTSDYVAWRKVENNESHLYCSIKEWSLNQWSDPDTVFITGDNINLRLSNATFTEGSTLCWENSDSISFLDNIYYPEPVWHPQYNGIENYHQPTAFNIDLITDYFLGVYSFIGGFNDITDIYIVDEMFSIDPINLTNDEEINCNPILYSGRIYNYYYEVLNIWQTQVNGFEVLYKSDAYYLMGATAENKSNRNQLSLSVSPCPFYDKVNIEFYLPEYKSYTLEFFSISGELIKHINSTTHVSGVKSLKWNPQNEGISLTDGVYFIKLSQGENSKVQKVVFSKH